MGRMRAAAMLSYVFTVLLGSALLGSGLLLLSGCGREAVSREEYLLGTLCRITLYGNRDAGLFDDLFDRIREIEAAMSVKLPSSEVSRINRAAGDPAAGDPAAVPVSQDTMEVIRASIRYGELTRGAFDVTIGPLVELWDIGGADFRPPPETAIRGALGLVDYRLIDLPDASSLAMGKPGMRLDLGGAAKGYAADELLAILDRRGVGSALVDLGGNIYAVGCKPNGDPWRIGVQNPFDSRGAALGAMAVTDRAVVTSGPYERYSLYQGVRYHHILAPSSGRPVRNGLAGVSILAKSALAADCLSTGAFVLGLEAGLALIGELPDVEAVFVTDERDVHLTAGLVGVFELLDDSFRLACGE